MSEDIYAKHLQIHITANARTNAELDVLGELDALTISLS